MHMQQPLTSATPLGAKSAGDPHSLRRQLHELRQALKDGWVIVQPIFARPLWSAVQDETTAFHFVLRRERATRLVTVPEGRPVTRFIRERALTIQGK
jgi:hypothetical protein